MSTGTVKWFNDSLGFGYITPDNEPDEAYVHISVLRKCGLLSIAEKQRVEYEMTSGLVEKQVCQIRLINK